MDRPSTFGGEGAAESELMPVLVAGRGEAFQVLGSCDGWFGGGLDDTRMCRGWDCPGPQAILTGVCDAHDRIH